MQIHKKITLLLIILGLLVNTNAFSQNMTWDGGSSTLVPDTVVVGNTTVFTTSFSEAGGVDYTPGQFRVEIEATISHLESGPGNPPVDGGFFTWSYDPDFTGNDTWVGINNMTISAFTATPSIVITYTGISVSASSIVINSFPLAGAIDLNLGDNGGTMAYAVVASTLPITLVEYTAEAVDKESELNWTTATEINNDYFTVEKSIDGKKWMFLAKVRGSGNSSSEINYQFTDNQPTLGANYYRLSQYDFNGDKEVVGIEAVQFNDDQLLDITVYPNPVVENLTLNIRGGDIDINEECILYNNEGKEIRFIKVNGRQTKIDMSDLIKGVYHLKINHKHFTVIKN